MRSSRIAARVFVALALVFLADRPVTAAETIRIGYLGPLTGIFAQAGKDMLDGLKLSLEQVGYQAGGRKIELFEEDTEGNTTTALAKYRKLVDHDKIHVLTGVLLANVGYSLVPQIERDLLPTLFLLRARLAIAGTPEDCIAQVRAAGAAGATELMFTVSLAADPVGTVELFGREVLPALARG